MLRFQNRTAEAAFSCICLNFLEKAMRYTLLAVTMALVLASQQAAAAPPSLEEKIDILQKEIDQLKAELAKVAGQQAAAPSAYSSTAGAQTVAGATTLGGYGEFAYNRFRNTDVNNNQADLRRFVMFLGHRFNQDLRFQSELEIEHAVASAEDRGEVELEQAFIDYRLNDAVNFKGGLFLIPLGILNETHEPPTYYGVERNFVETRIIPTTWREGGIGVYGELGQGLHYDVGITTGFDSGKIDDPNTAIRSGHQELQLANANDLSVYGALNYRGTPGLLLGGGIFTGNTGQNGASNALLKGVSARLTLWDLHAKYNVGDLDLQALYARGMLGDADRVTTALITASGDSTRIAPKTFDGWYAQAAYHLWKRNDMDFAPFFRYERFNTQKEVPNGFTANPLNDEAVTTAGFNFKLHPQVVLKADYQKFKTDSTRDRFDLGLGYMF